MEHLAPKKQREEGVVHVFEGLDIQSAFIKEILVIKVDGHRILGSEHLRSYSAQLTINNSSTYHHQIKKRRFRGACISCMTQQHLLNTTTRLRVGAFGMMIITLSLLLTKSFSPA